ncbi:glutamate ABC transporter substrate-binding protein [Nonomuraea sp. NPDC026600]|uniref:glutamate ABC transporter substrate-binding protein n=1 Tax=Nonomuraea sp. NPDC026600 TaxID=3155363 RepID=UPI0033EC329E
MRASPTCLVLTIALLAASLTACGGNDDSIVGKKTLVIGIKTDLPGLGLQTANGFTGLDVDIARYIARHLGVADGDVTLKKTTSDVREQFIEQGQVDLVVATYSISDDRKRKVSFAGPYLVTGQDILVLAGNTGITGVDSLRDKVVCGASGSNSPKRLAERFGGVADIANAWGRGHLKILNGYGACLPLLQNSTVDAISTDATVLAGFAAQTPGRFRLVGKPFSTEKYGIGLRRDDKRGRDAVNDALAQMFKDGSWKRFIDADLGEFGAYFTTPPALERY